MAERDLAITLSTNGNENPKVRFNPALVLREDGRIFLEWKVAIPSLMQAEAYASEVLTEEIKLEDANYATGNRNASTIFLNTIHPNLMLSLFYGDSATVSATQMWKTVKDQLTRQTRSYQEQAITAWMAYEFDTTKTAEDKLLYYY